MATSAFSLAAQSPWGKRTQWFGYFLGRGRGKTPFSSENKAQICTTEQGGKRALKYLGEGEKLIKVYEV